MNTTQTTKTDTPETDAEERSGYTYKTLLDHARNMERQRNAALRELAEAKKEIQILSQALENKKAMLEATKRARYAEAEHNRELCKATAELRKDKERLDWLDKHTALHGSTLHAKVRQPSINSTLREAIDLAKQSQ